jgi:hypothetical protein
MKTLAIRILSNCIIMVIVLSGLSVKAQIRAGVGKTNITPTLGTPMDGYYIERLASTVHDDLYARAMVLQDGSETLVLVVTDLIDVAPYGFPAARKRIQEELNVPAVNIIISATHTHTGPTFTEDYEKYVAKKIFDAVKIAFSNLQDVVIKSGTGKAEDIAFHRRFMMKDGSVKFNPGRQNPDIVEPMGPVDPGVGIIYLETLNGKPIAVLRWRDGCVTRSPNGWPTHNSGSPGWSHWPLTCRPSVPWRWRNCRRILRPARRLDRGTSQTAGK